MNATFKCGHPRSIGNTRINGRNRAWENAYRQRTNRNAKEKLRYQCKKLGLTPPKSFP